MYGRYFAYNIYHFAFNDMKKIMGFCSIQESTLTIIYQDPSYGLGSPDTLYYWVQAFNGGPSSSIYQEIFTYFNSKLPDFTQTTMEQLVGGKSLMKMQNYTFTYNVKSAFSLHSDIQSSDLAVPQWASCAITVNDKIPLNKTLPKLDSVS
jgi:hypothetical protein